MPSAEWRRWPLSSISMYSKIVFASSVRVFQRFRSSSPTCIRLQKDSIIAFTIEAVTDGAHRGHEARRQGPVREGPRGELGALV